MTNEKEGNRRLVYGDRNPLFFSLVGLLLCGLGVACTALLGRFPATIAAYEKVDAGLAMDPKIEVWRRAARLFADAQPAAAEEALRAAAVGHASKKTNGAVDAKLSSVLDCGIHAAMDACKISVCLHILRENLFSWTGDDTVCCRSYINGDFIHFNN